MTGMLKRRRPAGRRIGRLLVAGLAVLGLLLAGCGGPQDAGAGPGGGPVDGSASEGPSSGGGADEAEVRAVVEGFGRALQHVPLLAPEAEVRRAMDEHYAPYVTPDLLAAWQADPAAAPGRLVSSPWPDRIEISAVVRLPDGAYEVEGRILEVTSVEQGTDDAAAVRPVLLGVRRYDDRWLIHRVELGDDLDGSDPDAGPVTYMNRDYGFRFLLPESWRGYTVVYETWEGRALEDAAGGSVPAGDPAVEGPLLRLRHPRWTPERPRQDVPIMVFTLDQWESLNDGQFGVGAAPVAPTELGRNDAFVLALPARYNFEFAEGHEEVAAILEGNPLEPLAVNRSTEDRRRRYE